MKNDRITTLTFFLASIVLLLCTLIFKHIAIGLTMAIVLFPVLKWVSKQIRQKE